MTYPLETTPDGDTTWGQDTRDFATSVRTRLDLLERPSYNAQTGTTYTLAAADERKIITRTNAAATSTTLPTNASVAIAVGFRARIRNIGTTVSTIVGQGGTTVQSEGNALQLAGQFAEAEVEKTATDTWFVQGNLV